MENIRAQQTEIPVQVQKALHIGVNIILGSPDGPGLGRTVSEYQQLQAK